MIACRQPWSLTCDKWYINLEPWFFFSFIPCTKQFVSVFRRSYTGLSVKILSVSYTKLAENKMQFKLHVQNTESTLIFCIHIYSVEGCTKLWKQNRWRNGKCGWLHVCFDVNGGKFSMWCCPPSKTRYKIMCVPESHAVMKKDSTPCFSSIFYLSWPK